MRSPSHAWEIRPGDSRKALEAVEPGSVRTVVTSPPYFGAVRDYGADGQIGLEVTPEEYVAALLEVFGGAENPAGVWRALADDGTLWLNLGDSYATGGRGGGGAFMEERRDGAWAGKSRLNGWRSAPPGLKHKDLVGAPWRVALALQAAGWYLRADIIWHKPNGQPESVTDRPTKGHEYLFLMTKNPTYFYDVDAIREPHDDHRRRKAGATAMRGQAEMRPRGKADDPDRYYHPKGRNKRTVWTVPPAQFDGPHFATMPEGLVEPCILAGSAPGDLVLDPFCGAATVGMVAVRLGRRFLGVEINPEYVELGQRRMRAGPAAATAKPLDRFGGAHA